MTQLVAIINITPDSFSDGGLHESTDAALLRIEEAIRDGADVIDIGAESTRPGATPLSDEEEWQRLAPLLHALSHIDIEAKISLDSYHPNTIAQALELDVIDMINDVSGLKDPDMHAVVATANQPIVMMHSLSVPADKNRTLPEEEDVIAALNHWIDERLNTFANTINTDRIIIDPGVGFSKIATQSWDICKRIGELNTQGCPLYIGHSRKSFLGEITNKPSAERDPETLMVSQHLLREGVDYLRVHDVKNHAVLRHVMHRL